ncbi:SDR family NAD(P)-dependent oxidoreductase [Actinoallomurus sp. CA-150999]|uniref:SDR family NAD(P)-dependent oxidoreductase n=1 Tax=Actinoallomurus sp. CA-150999 TaxID=3239887 RepID=UPI003D8CD914
MVLIVTGGGSGIGAAVAELATAAGAQVVISGRRRDALEQVAERTGALVHAADLTTPGAPEALVGAALEAYGRVDAVVANAGVMRSGGLLEVSEQSWRDSLETNLTAVFRLARAAMPHLVRSRGALVTVSSIAALRAPAGAVAYASAKAAVTMLTQSIAVEFGPRGVRANTVCPGWVRTEMADMEMREFGEPEGLSVPDAYAEVTRLSPQRRPAAPAEVAEAIWWLAGPAASAVNGAVLTVDGGTTVIDPGTVPFEVRLTPRRP